jgi:hypothetical protein
MDVSVEPREMTSRTREATRLLCAAAYLDSSFADTVVRDVLEEEQRALAPSYGVDLVPVFHHCVAARRRRLIRSILLGILLLAVPIFIAAGASPVTAALRVLLLSWGIVFVAACLQRYQVLAGLQRNRFVAAAMPPADSARQYERIRRLDRDTHGNVTVYSGFTPFVGAGVGLEKWSFTLNTGKGRHDLYGSHEPVPFDIDELYDHVGTELGALDVDGLEVGHRLFANGQDIRHLPWLLPDPYARPLPIVDGTLVTRFLRSPTHRVRHYLVVQFLDWQGELVVSIFVRFARSGVNLLSEAAFFVLPPLQEKYHAIDRLAPTPDLGSALWLIVKSAVLTLPLLILAPLIVVQRAFASLTHLLRHRRIRRDIRTNPAFDYGAVTSVRQSGTSDKYRRYFQVLDAGMYVQLAERCILDSVLEFLEEHNVDVSELKERQNTILNNGVIVSGGSMNANNMAVGEGASASTGASSKGASKKKGNAKP